MLKKIALPLALLLAVVCGCGTISSEEFDALQRLSVAMAEARKDYRIQPGDTVKVVVYRGATLPPEYQQTITVQPDGKITLVNVDRAIQAQGRTVPELQDVITRIYEPLFKAETRQYVGKFDVTVQFLTSEINAWLPDQIYVTGEVEHPVAIPYRKGLRVLQAISVAGGWKYTANESRIVLLRTDPTGQTVTRELDLASVVGHITSDAELFPGDVVYVPLSAIAKVNLFVQFYIRGLLPFNPSSIRYFFTGF